MVEAVFWLLVENVIASFEEENRIIEEILLEDEDWQENEGLMPQRDIFDELGNILDDVFGRIFQMEMLQMAVEDEEIFEVLYGNNCRTIDWKAELPKMQYMRHMEDPTFRMHFRMNTETFEKLIVVMGNHLTVKGRLCRLRTEIDKSLLMALWILSNPDTFRATGLMFGVSRGTVHFHYLVVIEALRELAPKFIKWPSLVEKDRMKRRLEERTGYPGIVGMIDGTLIRITAPCRQKERYFDRHQSYSLNVQAVCDDDLLVRHIYMGEPGSVHDVRVFERSPLHDIFLERQDVVADDEHIIGDGGYELTNKLLIPFRDLGNITCRQRRFNYIHSSIRMSVERVFGRVKEKFRRLMKLYCKRLEYSLDHIMSSFVLHNFIILEGRESDGVCIMQPHRQDHQGRDFDVEEENEDDTRDGVEDEENVYGVLGGGQARRDMEHPLLAVAKVAGAQKREAIADLIFQIVNN